MNFHSLIEHIKQLSQSDKNKIMAILKENSLPVVEEEHATYLKTSTKKDDFEQKWRKSLTAEQFKEAVVQHIDTLPWK
ncbi:hypothetical protein EZ449_03040 [Pedobacter frigidisoli]|uniref:Uncharacterized protein n=1 Tax=Pedobacter frigidisoli TaxID=2530455 RepID=A0A4V2MNB0_9SPHI|nr:hypothetical protein [Pedobacter frigidisoli]TCD12018.1 hypothetical protein EZ449_03040 [Pedobacter frigidisoli]